MRHLQHAGLSGFLVAGLLALSGCSGKTFTSGSAQGGVVSGAACATEGARAEAADGCNTCECHSGAWVCTETTCEPTCQEGDQKEDGCNTCSCSGGQWVCTDVACPAPCTEGETVPAEDGCNTCSCSGGELVCTQMDCAACIEGDTVPAGDGCNTCTCIGGVFACTGAACVVPECQDGEMRADECSYCECSGGQWLCSGACPAPVCPEPQVTALVCVEVIVAARDPDTGACCVYGTPCEAPADWVQFHSPEECEGAIACVPGDDRSAADGCNTCTCTDAGSWECTATVCACTAGETRRAADGCNVCTCDDMGQWGCTEMACTDPQISCGGWSGDTCTDDEYCAYEPGAYCGGADAPAACQPRPTACDANLEPVCGCDGNTYSNACEAAMAGTGVYEIGGCAVGAL